MGQRINSKQSIFIHFSISLSSNNLNIANTLRMSSLNNTAFGSRAEVHLTSAKGNLCGQNIHILCFFRWFSILGKKIYTFSAPFAGFSLKGTESQDRF
jgi:hypothetical protein